MRQSVRTRRNYIIIGLCMVLVLMAGAYATFSSFLQIKGTSNITSNWCVGFDSTLDAATPTSGPKSATSPTGTITYNGTACETNYKSGASLSANLYQPCDSVEYTLTIKNASTLDAAIDSINVEGSNVTSNTAVTKGNVTFSVRPIDVPKRIKVPA